MTGQVKEDVLSRFAELGVRIDEGILRFDPVLFESRELIKCETKFSFYSLRNELTSLSLPPGSFAFTVCQTPIVYQHSDRSAIVVHRGDDQQTREGSLQLTRAETMSLFSRDGAVTQIDVLFNTDTSH
jgi:hypothetical protein